MPTPMGSPSLSENEGDGMMEFYATPSPSEEDDDENHKEDAKDEFKEELKIEFRRNSKKRKLK